MASRSATAIVSPRSSISDERDSPHVACLTGQVRRCVCDGCAHPHRQHLSERPVSVHGRVRADPARATHAAARLLPRSDLSILAPRRMSAIVTENPDLLTDLDVAYSQFHCCGDEDLVFVRCPACGHLMVLCCECDTLYADLASLQTQSVFARSAESERPLCPRCQVPFAHDGFLSPPHVDRYLATARQVDGAGFGHLLAPHRRT